MLVTPGWLSPLKRLWNIDRRYVFIGLARTVYIYTPYMTVHLVIFLPKIPYVHRIYMVLANPINTPTSRNRQIRNKQTCVSSQASARSTKRKQSPKMSSASHIRLAITILHNHRI